MHSDLPLPIVFVFLSSLSYSAANHESHFRGKCVNAHGKSDNGCRDMDHCVCSLACFEGQLCKNINVKRTEKWRLSIIIALYINNKSKHVLYFLNYHA